MKSTDKSDRMFEGLQSMLSTNCKLQNRTEVQLYIFHSIRKLYILMKKQSSFNRHYAMYTITNLIYGMCYTGIGPLIPFLAQQAQREETSYSFLFFFRAAGMIVGTFAFAQIKKRQLLNFHQLIMGASLGILIVLSAFTILESLLLQEISIFLNGFFNGILETTVNLSTVMLTNGDNIQTVFVIVFGMFGAGGLIGPFIVYIIKSHTFLFFGFVTAVFAIPYLILQTPETLKKEEQNKNENKKYLPKEAANSLYLIMLIYVGSICSVGGWISSYSVLQKSNDKQFAVIYTSLFWGSITLSRLAMLLVPGTSSYKMKICLYTSIAAILTSVGLKGLGFTKQALIFQSIVLGASISAFYPMIYSISKQLGYELDQSQIGNIVAAGPIGEGLLPMICGLTMQWISNDMFFYVVVIYFVLIAVCRFNFIKIVNYHKNIQINLQCKIEQAHTISGTTDDFQIQAYKIIPQ